MQHIGIHYRHVEQVKCGPPPPFQSCGRSRNTTEAGMLSSDCADDNSCLLFDHNRFSDFFLASTCVTCAANFVVIELSWIVPSIDTGLLSIHISAITESSISREFTSPFATVFYFSAGNPRLLSPSTKVGETTHMPLFWPRCTA